MNNSSEIPYTKTARELAESLKKIKEGDNYSFASNKEAVEFLEELR